MSSPYDNGQTRATQADLERSRRTQAYLTHHPNPKKRKRKSGKAAKSKRAQRARFRAQQPVPKVTTPLYVDKCTRVDSIMTSAVESKRRRH